jgi:glycosyltransferase involved in cell wall biosynthesis
MPTEGRQLKVLIVSPADPLTGKPRAGPLRRFRNPPPGVRYAHVTDRVAIPTSRGGQYSFSPMNVGLSAVKFALEHALPLDYRGASLVHTFFWDVRKFTVPWVHESDQSIGQYLTGYNNVRGFVRKAVTEGYAPYLNSRGCAGIVTWTEWAKRGFEEEGIDKGKVFVVPPPFEVVSDARAHEGCNILFIGRDFHRKGGDLMLRAFGRIDSPDCRLIYVGKADERAKKKMSGDGRIAYHERATGTLLAEEIWPYVDVLALPTRADAFAMTVAEAMSRGIPVVATGIPPIVEVVEDGESGFLFPLGDETRFLEGLSRLAGDESLRKKLGRRAQERVEVLFAPSTVGKRLMEVYRRA